MLYSALTSPLHVFLNLVIPISVFYFCLNNKWVTPFTFYHSFCSFLNYFVVYLIKPSINNDERSVFALNILFYSVLTFLFLMHSLTKFLQFVFLLSHLLVCFCHFVFLPICVLSHETTVELLYFWHLLYSFLAFPFFMHSWI